MASKKLSVALLIVAIAVSFCATSSMATEFHVGDSAGWTSLPWIHFDSKEYESRTNLKDWVIDYRVWPLDKKFQVGDTLIFNYDNRYDNVVQVTLVGYLSCDPTSPIATYNSGSDTVTLDRPGDYYFINGSSEHCWDADQKLEVSVGSSTSLNPPSSSPNPSPSSAPSSTHSAFSPSPSSGSPPNNNNNLSLMGCLWCCSSIYFPVVVV